MKKILSLLLAVCIIASLLAACGGSSNPADSNQAQASTDKYRSFYQVWIGSFCDSDGDKTGDLPGLISKLDYINDGDPNKGDDLGADGIWLSPMMPSTTYHKYNVRDYYNIDPQFGTLDDFDKLIEECHSRGVHVIIDLVLNHSGGDHEFFLKACDELREGKEDGYARYYNFSKTQDLTYQHAVTGSDYYYQGDFWDQMPDWNLSFEGTREYFEDVTKFWLDRGVDGFRLDAVKYFQDKNTDAEEFLGWFCDMARGYNPDVYVVGEDWDDAGNVYDMYESGVDSLFNFKFANSGGEFMVASHSMTADALKKLKKYDDNIKKRSENAINANFLTNHDMVRVANIVDEDDNKMAAALYMLAPGNSFTYNGEEIGIEAAMTSSDAYYRTAMIWDNENLPDITVEGIKAEENALGGVEQQLKDDHSLLSTYRRLIKLRLQNPEIARGDIEEVLNLGDSNVGGMIINDDGSRVVVIHNTTQEAKELTIDMIDNPEIRGWTYADLAAEPIKDEPKLSSTALTLPARTSIVLKEVK
ncbi:MAG: alpha amylase [Ruminococcus sp.]|nr:alpha amylase [Ruminococcus sp.]